MSVMHLNMVFIQVLVLRTGRKALVEVDDPYLRDPESANNLSEGPSYSQWVRGPDWYFIKGGG